MPVADVKAHRPSNGTFVSGLTSERILPECLGIVLDPGAVRNDQVVEIP